MTNGMVSDDESLQLPIDDQKPRIVAGLNKPVNTKPLGEQSLAVRRQGLMCILANIGLLTAGMALGLPTVTLPQLTNPEERVHLTVAQASWFASINALACPLGGVLSGFVLDQLGRKCTLFLLNAIGLVAWLLMALAVQDDSEVVYIQLLVSRFCIGITTGLCSAPVGVYAAEICLPKIRGRMILGTSISVATGITIIYLMGFFIRNDWHLIAWICVGYTCIALISLIPLPETPSWLISKGRLDDAKRSLNYFRGQDKTTDLTHPEVIAEFNLLQKSIQLGEGEKKQSFLQQLRLPEVYKPLLILMGLFGFQQLTGIFVVIAYAVQIATEAGVSIDPFMCAIFIGVARVITTIPMTVILECWGRRRAGIVSAFGMTICMFLLAGHGSIEWLHNIPYLPVIAIVAFIVLSTLGLYTLPFFMISELFPQKVRGPASGLTVAVGMFISFLTLKTYPAMKASIGGDYCFVVYGCIAFVALIFIYLALPETRRRTLLEIEERFRTGKSGKSSKPAEVEMQEVFIKR